MAAVGATCGFSNYLEDFPQIMKSTKRSQSPNRLKLPMKSEFQLHRQRSQSPEMEMNHTIDALNVLESDCTISAETTTDITPTTLLGAGSIIVNFNGFIVWILVYIMTIWQYIAIISLPMHCVGNNHISLSNSPGAYRHTCGLWYGNLACWGRGICTLSFPNLIHILALRTLKWHRCQR